MKSDPELDALVASLREDLPSEQDSARLRARLSALGLAASHALVSTSAAAANVQGTASAASAASGAQAASVGVAAAGKVAIQAGAVSWAVKAGVVAVVATASLAGPVWLVHTRSASVASANSASEASPLAVGTTARVTRATGAGANANTNANRVADVAADPSAPTEPGVSERADVRANGGERPAALSVPASERNLGATAAPTSATDSATWRLPSAAPASTGGALQPSQLAANSVVVQPAAASTAGFAQDDASTPSAVTRPAPAIEPTTLREETALIDGALAALRNGDSARALGLLSEHRRRFPNGLLTQERERALHKMSELRNQRSAP